MISSSISSESAFSRAAVSSRSVSSTCPRLTVDDRASMDLFYVCLKLSNENKINEKNSWDLKLIDHISDIVKVEALSNEEINFQKASCALEMGVKIYSVRVDSLHSKAFKVLGSFNRTGLENQKEIEFNTRVKEESEEKISPLTTLESSFEALNLKKFDVAISKEPLSRQLSTLYIEKGVKGLLLNNLGVNNECRVCFDSLEEPVKPRPVDQSEVSAVIDLSFAKESIEQMVMNMRKKCEISPTLSEILSLGNNPRADSFQGNIEVDSNSPTYHDWSFYHGDDDETTITDENNSFKEPTFQRPRENELNISMLLCQHFELNSKRNDWAGPDHWNYHNPKGVNKIGHVKSTRMSKRKRIVEADLEFSSSINKEIPDIFAPPRNPKSLLLSVNRSLRSNSLPEDYHYELKDLVKLFLLPNVQCLGQKSQKYSGSNSWEDCNYSDEEIPSRDKETEHSVEFNNIDSFHYFEDPDNLNFDPHQVNQDEFRSDKASKQIDMTWLKKSLWDQMQEDSSDSSMSFKHLFNKFPIKSRDATPEELSPQLLFLCLLHLANEHGLVIQDCPSLDDLTIHIPSC